MACSGSTLPTRVRLLTQIAALYALRRRAKAFDLVRMSIQSRTTPKSFFSELFIHLSLFLGYPAMLDGLERLHALTATSHARQSDSRDAVALRARGMATLRKVYGKQAAKLLEHLDDLQPGLGKRITEHAYGTVMARTGLSLAERELATVVVLFIEGYQRQLYSHIRGALRTGVSPATLKAVLRCAGRTARKDVRKAISTVDEIVRTQTMR